MARADEMTRVSTSQVLSIMKYVLGVKEVIAPDAESGLEEEGG
jgi:hypothetical protein